MRLAILAAALLATTPAFAVDAIVYKGTLGKLEILAELASPSTGHLVGRYSYLNKGGDIPLDLMDGANGAIKLAEEAPCTETTCVQDENGDVTDTPIGAIWTLTPSADGKTLTGTWQDKAKGGKSFDVTLTQIGARTLSDDTEITPYGLYDSEQSLTYTSGAIFAPHTAPYMFAKMEVPYTTGPEQTLEGSTYRYVTDPRTKFAFPRILSFSDGSSVEQANQALERRHTTLNSFAFDCLSQVYAGFGANEYTINMETGTLAGWDEENVEIAYLSPTVLGWTEGGSTYCTGAYPDNHFSSIVLDAKTGEPLPLAYIFNDWIATESIDDYGSAVDQAAALEAPETYFWGADKTLIDYVVANRAKGEDAEFDEECGIDDLIATNLGLRFAPGDTVVFSLVDLPHVIFACTEDLLTVKLADIPELLAPTAQDYFPALGQSQIRSR
ncbi:hypothetical protein [Devosia sp. 2618]|uniref:hypothetical protein n=1 Tax=Devosia sp. 2618 TaxID=3156454 RepID=UPI003391859A